MAKYTTQIRSIVEAEHPIFDFDYPIFDNGYRAVLEKKIIDHYYFSEIGFETVGQFKHFLKSRLNVIMPYYNQLYETEGLVNKDNYNINLDNTITQKRTVDQISEGKEGATAKVVGGSTEKTDASSSTNETNNETGKTINVREINNQDRQVFSDTPQGKLSGLDYATNLTDNDGQSVDSGESDSSLDGERNTVSQGETSVTGTKNENTTEERTNEGTAKTVDDYIERLVGNGSMRYNADILMEWRKSFLNIDQQIIGELQDLFMNIY